MRTPVILIVDDEAILRILATDHFNDAGFEVLEASNGAQATALLKSRPDIKAVFTDVQMPGRPDGLEIARRVREINREAAIVVVSGRIVPSGQELASGARFMHKPYEGAALVQLFREMIYGLK